MNKCPKCGAIHKSPLRPRPNGYVPCVESQVCFAEGGPGCLRRQLAAVTAERDKARYGEAEAMAVIMSLEGMCERITAERDELQRKLGECRAVFILWRDENRKPGPYGIGHKWRAIDGPLYNVLNRHLGGE